MKQKETHKNSNRMKTQTLFIAMALLFASSSWTLAANRLDNENVETETYQIMDDSISVGDMLEIDTRETENGDTVNIRIGNKNMKIVSKDEHTHISVDKLDNFESKWGSQDWNVGGRVNSNGFNSSGNRRNRKFSGHWMGIDLGSNQLWNVEYPLSLYPAGTLAFLETRPERSLEFNFNFWQYSFGFTPYIGIVTGLGFNFNNYRFDNSNTIFRDDDNVLQSYQYPVSSMLEKTKLTTTFLTAPLMLEFQIPGQNGDRLFLAAGVIGGVKLGQHTKVKINGEKTKNRNDLNINPLRWGYTARIGFENVGVYGTYYNTKMFKENLAPVATPWTVGITLTFRD